MIDLANIPAWLQIAAYIVVTVGLAALSVRVARRRWEGHRLTHDDDFDETVKWSLWPPTYERTRHHRRHTEEQSGHIEDLNVKADAKFKPKAPGSREGDEND